MTLRCKPGDIVIVVNAGAGCRNVIGSIVRVRKAHHDPALRGGWVWSYYGLLRSVEGKRIKRLNDFCLRPLRDDPGQDETLRIAGLPAPVSLRLKETAV